MTPSPSVVTPPARDRIKERLRSLAHEGVAPLVAGLSRRRVSPLSVTVLGLVLSVAAGAACFAGSFRWGAGLLLLAGLCDILDGQLARHQGSVSKLGAFLDSTLDRLGEAAVLTGICGFAMVRMLSGDPAGGLWAFTGLSALVALTGSFLVSYTRARAEGLGLDCRVGWFERPERMVLLILAGAFGEGPVMPVALTLLAVLSWVTVGQRVAHVWKLTRAQ